MIAATASALRRPPRLQEGCKVAVVAPSSGTLEPSLLERGVRLLEGWGLEVTVMPNVRSIRGYLAGEDHLRAADLVQALSDDSFDAVWCARGGYGAMRTVAALSDDMLGALEGAKPKVFVGYSDVTVLHALVARSLGWVSFYGPTVTSLGRASSYTLDALRAAVFDAGPFEIGANPDDDWVTTFVEGTATGRLRGGCLALLAALVGTPLQVDFGGAVAFFEDVDESPARIDRFLSQLLAAGCFDGCRGIVIGEHIDIEVAGGASLGLEQVFEDLLAPLGVPCCYGLPLGHGRHLATVPLGITCRMDATSGTVRFDEPGVEETRI